MISRASLSLPKLSGGYSTTKVLVSSNVAQNPIVAQHDLTSFAIVAQTLRRPRVDKKPGFHQCCAKSHSCATWSHELHIVAQTPGRLLDDKSPGFHQCCAKSYSCATWSHELHIVAQTLGRLLVDKVLVSINVAQNPIVAQRGLTSFAIVAQTLGRLLGDKSPGFHQCCAKSQCCAT